MYEPKDLLIANSKMKDDITTLRRNGSFKAKRFPVGMLDHLCVCLPKPMYRDRYMKCNDCPLFTIRCRHMAIIGSQELDVTWL